MLENESFAWEVRNTNSILTYTNHKTLSRQEIFHQLVKNYFLLVVLCVRMVHIRSCI